MVKGEGLQVLHERRKNMDPDQNEIYKYLGVEHADEIKTKDVYDSVKEEVITKTQLNDKNFNQSYKYHSSYAMNVCKFTQSELTEFDQVIKRDLRKNNMLGRQEAMKDYT